MSAPCRAPGIRCSFAFCFDFYVFLLISKPCPWVCRPRKIMTFPLKIKMSIVKNGKPAKGEGRGCSVGRVCRVPHFPHISYYSLHM